MQDLSSRMKKMMRVLVSAVMMFFVLGCQLNSSIQADQQKVSELQAEVKALTDRVDQLQFAQILNDKSTAYFSPEQKGFSTVDTGSGFMWVAMQSLHQYGDGYKVKLDLGNPFLARYQNPKIVVKWGKRNSLPSNLRQTEITLNRTLLPGSWNNTEIVLAPATSEEIGNIQVQVQVASVVLAK